MLYNEKCAVESINKISNWHKLYHVKLKGIPFGEVSNVVNSFFVGCLLAVDWRIERMPENFFFVIYLPLPNRINDNNVNEALSRSGCFIMGFLVGN